MAGPSVAPRDGQSRRGAPLADAGAASRRAASAPQRAPRRADTAHAASASGRRPAVIHHRGTPIEPHYRAASPHASARAYSSARRRRAARSARRPGAVPGPRRHRLPRHATGDPLAFSDAGCTRDRRAQCRRAERLRRLARRSVAARRTPDDAVPRGGGRPAIPRAVRSAAATARSPRTRNRRGSGARSRRGSQGEAPRATPGRRRRRGRRLSPRAGRARRLGRASSRDRRPRRAPQFDDATPCYRDGTARPSDGLRATVHAVVLRHSSTPDVTDTVH